jgi:hypothetical protein
MSYKSVSAVALLSMVLTACAGSEVDGTEADTPDPSADEPVLQIISEGGFVPVEIALGNGPRYTLLGDGRLIFQGVQTLQFPGPLVAPFLVAQLDNGQMTAVLAMVEDIGLPGFEDELDNTALNFVADASTEKITYWDENGEHRFSVYALGIQDSPPDRNVAFLELIETFDRFTASADADPYLADRVQILSGPGFANEEFPDNRPWPLDDAWDQWEELDIGWTCRVFDGDILDVFADATQATTWEIPDVFGYSSPAKLLVRPVFPGEEDCP